MLRLVLSIETDEHDERRLMATANATLVYVERLLRLMSLTFRGSQIHIENPDKKE